MEINIEDYVDQDEIRQIVREEVRTSIRRDPERILSNLAYHLGTGFIQDLIEDEDLENLKKVIKRQLSEDRTISFELFKEPSAWDCKQAIKVSSVMQKTIEENLYIIKDKTIEALNNIDKEVIKETIEMNFDQVIVSLIKSLSKS